VRIIRGYLIREIILSFLAVGFILLLTTVGLFFGDILADVAAGRVPAALLFSQVGLRSIETLTILLPISLFLAIMLSFGRMSRDSEMIALRALGYGHRQLIRPIAYLAVPLAVLMLVVGLWVSPWAIRSAKVAVKQASQEMSVSGLQPGRFHVFAARDSVVYVEEIQSPDSGFSHAFIHSEKEGRKDVVTAQSGFQYQDPETGARYLALVDGFRSEGVPGRGDYRLMRFARNDVRLPDPVETDKELKRKAWLLEDLLQDSDPLNLAEIHWRVAPACSVLVLCFLALPLSRSKPRQGYYGNLIDHCNFGLCGLCQSHGSWAQLD